MDIERLDGIQSMGNFFTDLNRWSVLQITMAYLAISCFVLQILTGNFPNFHSEIFILSGCAYIFFHLPPLPEAAQ